MKPQIGRIEAVVLTRVAAEAQITLNDRFSSVNVA
jgi:hypothetical protein